MKIKAIFAAALMAVAAINMTSCTEKKFRVEGTIKGANDSTLYLENMSLNGPVAVDSVKLSEDGKFSFAEKASEAPEFYRLRIACKRSYRSSMSKWNKRKRTRKIIPFKH